MDNEIENANEIVIEGENAKYITVDGEKVFNVLPLLEYYEAALNGRQSEHKTRAWKDVVPEWFNSNLQMPFNDQKHVLNSFSKYLMDKKPNGHIKTAVPKLTLKDLES